MIPRIAVGTWGWNDRHGCALRETDLRPVFDRAMQFGFTLWDTAPGRDDGAGEALLGQLASRRRYLQFSTRFAPHRLQRKAAMAQSLERSLAHLQTDHAEIFWLQHPGNLRKWQDILPSFLEEGKCTYIGIVEENLEKIQNAFLRLREMGLRLSAVQLHYSLLHRQPEEAGVLRWCREHGVVCFSYLVLEQGALTGRYTKETPMPKVGQGKYFSPMVLGKLQPLLETMQTLGAAHLADAAQLAIAWAIAKGTVPIIGMTKPHHVTEESKALYLHLEPWEIQQLELAAKRCNVVVP